MRCVMQQVKQVHSLVPEESTPFVGEALRQLREEIGNQSTVLGFVGAPFTLATYIVEGGSSKNFANIKRMAFTQPEILHALNTKLADMVADYVRYQARPVAPATRYEYFAEILLVLERLCVTSFIESLLDAFCFAMHSTGVAQDSCASEMNTCLLTSFSHDFMTNEPNSTPVRGTLAHTFSQLATRKWSLVHRDISRTTSIERRDARACVLMRGTRGRRQTMAHRQCRSSTRGRATWRPQTSTSLQGLTSSR